jgi:hypothetical protein
MKYLREILKYFCVEVPFVNPFRASESSFQSASSIIGRYFCDKNTKSQVQKEAKA